MRLVFTRTPRESWIQYVVDVALITQRNYFFETVVQLLGTFLFVKTSRAMGLDLGTLYISFGCGIISGVALCVNACMMLEKVKRNFSNVVELQIENFQLSYPCIMYGGNWCLKETTKETLIGQGRNKKRSNPNMYLKICLDC